MHITWLGHSCFKIQDKISADGLTVVTDPFGKDCGLKLTPFEADIVTIARDHDDHNNLSAIKGSPYVVRHAGEYDIKGVGIQGADVWHEDKKEGKNICSVIYRIEMDDMSVTHLGNLMTTLDNKRLEIVAGTDILLIPVGGKNSIDAKKAVEVIAQIEPRIVIPMQYAMPGLKYELDGLEKFIKEMGMEPEREDKLKINRKDLPQENMRFVVLAN